MAKRKNTRRAVRREAPTFDWREITKLMVFAVIVFTLVWVARGIDDIPIKTIEVASKLEKVNKDLVRSIAANYYQQGFFTAHLVDFENELNSIPWVYKANIKRKWPGKLVIAVEEQSPRFRWTGQSLLNKEAIPFLVNNFDAYQALPKLSGLAGREAYLASLYDKYNEQFKRLGFSIASIEEDARYDKVITLLNGISINVGREKTNQQIERCLQSFSEFTENERAAIASIDLRHSNGFAVRWNG